MECPGCHAEVPDGARFCTSCGNPMIVACSQCGTELSRQARFCSNCGHRQTEPETDPARAKLERYIPRELFTKLEASRTGGAQGERRVVTMLFCDVIGSTAAAERLDPEDWAQIMNGAFEHLIAPVYRYEGTLARLMGDAILAFFGAPIAHEDDPQRAVRAGLEIVQAVGPYRQEVRQQWGVDFEVRVGINTGLVVVGEVGSDLRVEYTALGDAINVAARMEQTARPGTVQVAGDTHRLVEPLFDFEDLGPTEVKGKAEPVRAYRVVGTKSVPGRLRGIEGLSAPLIGRKNETDVLRQTFARLRQGRGGILCMIGEAGLGKSRLIGELRNELSTDGDSPIEWTEAGGVSYDTSRPYGLFMQQLRHVFGVEENDPPDLVHRKVEGGLAGLPSEERDGVTSAVGLLLSPSPPSAGSNVEGETVKRRMFEGLLRVWRRVSRPTVIVSEDLHWADPASVELLIHLIQLAERVPILFLCTFRPERRSPAWQVKLTSETDYPHLYTEIELGALSEEDSDELFGNLLSISGFPSQLRQRVLAKTEGNPFFVEEFIRTLIDSGSVTREANGLQWRPDTQVDEVPIPENLRALLTSRIDRLEEGARRTLQLSSVIGRSFYHRVLELISESPSDLGGGLSVLQRAELIREAARVPELEYIFCHDLTREAAYSSILVRVRREFHSRVGWAVEELFGDRLEDQAHRLAHHFYEAQDYQRALKYSLMAGHAAARLYAHTEANAHYSRAVELVDRVPSSSELRIEVYLARGRTLELVGEFDEALANYQQLEGVARESHDRGLELAALIPQATVHSTSNPKFDPEKGRALSNKGLSLARELGDHRAEARVLWNLMLLEYYEGRNREEAIRYGEQSLSIAREHDLTEQLAYTLNDIARAYFTVGKGDLAWAAQKESMDLLRKLGNLPMLTDSLITSAGGHYFTGEFDEALASAEECLAVSKSIGSQWGQAVSLYLLGAVYMERGEIGRSVDALNEALPLAQQAGFAPAVTVRLRLALFCGMFGDVEHGFDLAQQALEEGDNRQFSLAALAQFHLCNGDPVEADALIQEACKEFENGESDPRAGYAIFQVIEGEIALANKRYDRALSLTDRTIATLREMGQRVFLPDILRCRGETLLALGRTAEAKEVLLEALALAESQGSRRALWPVLAVLGRLASDGGATAEVETLNNRAREMSSYIADNAGSEESRAAFLNLAKVKELVRSR